MPRLGWGCSTDPSFQFCPWIHGSIPSQPWEHSGLFPSSQTLLCKPAAARGLFGDRINAGTCKGQGTGGGTAAPGMGKGKRKEKGKRKARHSTDVLWGGAGQQEPGPSGVTSRGPAVLGMLCSAPAHRSTLQLSRHQPRSILPEISFVVQVGSVPRGGVIRVENIIIAK